jgi:hypothetical protein
MFFTAADVAIAVTEADGDELIVEIATPAGVIELVGQVRIAGRVLYFTGAHIQGLHPGALGRDGLNVIGRKLLSEADVEEIVIEGGTRTTGLRKGLKPRTFLFPRR